jgi:predicted phage terminase large subunit-like protein
MSDPLIPSEYLKHASPQELEYYLKLLKAEQALKSPLDYAMYCNPAIQPYAHTQYLNEVLVALTEKRLYKSGPSDVPAVLIYRNKRDKKGMWVHPITGERALHRVMISLPPQVGKSLIVGESFCPWYMRTHKDENLLYITYASPLAEKISRKAMGTIERTPELGTILDPSRSSIKNWAIEGGLGEFLARGVTGSVTGFGGNVVFDDPHANGTEAASETERNKVLELWDSSIATRTGGGFKWAVVIQTRWHPSDLVGHLQEKDMDNWFVVVMPALAYETTNEDGISIHPELGIIDPLNRRPGESVCPELFAEEDFEMAKKREPFWFDAEYQQLPATAGAAIFRKFNYYKLTDGMYEIFKSDGESEFVQEKSCYRFAIMDLATSTKESADYTVYGVFDVTPSRKLLLRHIIRERVPSDKHISFLYENTNIWKPQWVGIEDYTYGTALIQNAIAKGGIMIRKLKEKGDKMQRALVLPDMISNDQFFISIDDLWVPDYKLEMFRFRGKGDDHDDQVDITSYAGLQWKNIPTFRQQVDEVGPTPTTAVAPSHRRARRKNYHDEVGEW